MTTDTQSAPTDAEIEALAVEHEAFGFGRVDARGLTTHGFDPDGLGSFSRAVLAKWGTPTPVGVEPVTPFIPAQRERLFYNRPENIGKGLALADWHRVVQYVEAAHGIGAKGGQHG